VFISAWSHADEIDKFLASRLVVGQIYFAKQSSSLTPENQDILAALVADLKRANQQGRLIRVEGFASRDGHEDLNLEISMKRAIAVKRLLERHGLAVELFLTGFGEKLNSTGKLSENRRVDIATYKNNRAATELFKKTGHVERYNIK
jgi:outer membrane protein OmpA-like peptidoglycan-associated protein